MGGGYTNPHIRDLGQPVVVLHGGLAAAGEAGYVSQAFSRLDNCPCVFHSVKPQVSMTYFAFGATPQCSLFLSNL